MKWTEIEHEVYVHELNGLVCTKNYMEKRPKTTSLRKKTMCDVRYLSTNQNQVAQRCQTDRAVKNVPQLFLSYETTGPIKILSYSWGYAQCCQSYI